MKYVITDNRMPDDCKTALRARGYEIIALPFCEVLSASVASHPDMLLFICDTLLCHAKYYSVAKKEIDQISSITGLDLTLSSEEYGEKYPNDILFNAVTLGCNIFCLESHTSQYIKEYAYKNGLELINVRQGYTKCSVCKVDDRAIITSDKGIADAAKKAGIDTLEISQGHIHLDGCQYGFIGGASGADGNSVFFCGNLDLHPNGQSIRDFCRSHGKTAVSLSADHLCDVGSLIFI